MKRRFFASLAAAAAVTASMVMVSAADAATPDTTAAGAQSAGVTPDANVPEAVRVGPGYKIVASLRGVGKQIYDCNGAAYAFREPAAGLFTSRGVRLPSTARGRSGRTSTARAWTAARQRPRRPRSPISRVFRG